MDKWDEVSVSAEFEQCCQEVAAGEYVPTRVLAFIACADLFVDGVRRAARPSRLCLDDCAHPACRGNLPRTSSRYRRSRVLATHWTDRLVRSQALVYFSQIALFRNRTNRGGCFRLAVSISFSSGSYDGVLNAPVRRKVVVALGPGRSRSVPSFARVG